MGLEEITDSTTEDLAEYALQQAADLFFLATGATTDPEDSQLARIVGYGIMAMAEWFIATGPSRGQSYEPVSTERIASQSYTKAKNIENGWPTDVLWFDRAVEAIKTTDDGADMLITTTRVFEDMDNLIRVVDETTKTVTGPATLLAPGDIVTEGQLHDIGVYPG